MAHSTGQLLYIPSEEEAWQVATVLSQDAEGIIVRAETDGSEYHITGSIHDFDTVTREQLAAEVSNLVELESYSEGIVLHHIRKRYQAQHEIYTFVGNILVAVNPYQDVTDRYYTPGAVDKFKSAAQRNVAMEPHVFAVAAQTYQMLLEDNASQSVLISGESGAGKTETTKKILQYLAAVAGGSSADAGVSVEQQILQSNPVLESFGNAKTTRNNNSSRFGKYMEVFFEGAGTIKGCSIISYLLEKSRVVVQNRGERNFHVFYMLLVGSGGNQRQELRLTSADEFHYLSQSGCTAVDQRDDLREYEAMERAMRDLGFDTARKQSIFRLLAGILHLGNVVFAPASTSPEADDGSAVMNRAVLEHAARLMGLPVADLERALCFRESTFGDNETIMIPLDTTKASDQRDAMAKDIYGRLFEWLIARVNDTLNTGSTTRSIGVLDIFGFEVFKVNSFEQFCINFANEKLQFFFNEVIFRAEMELYRSERVPCEDISFQDNQACIDLIERKNVGILAKLDEEIIVPRGSDAKFVSKLHQMYDENRATRNPFYGRNRRRPTEFVVRHFAGEVPYATDGFMEKNKDTLSIQILRLLVGSQDPFVASVYAPAHGEAHNPEEARKLKKTLGTQFKEDLQSLMDVLRQTNPHFIRCVKPNSRMLAFEMEPPLALRQLLYAGLFEAIRIRKSGYAVRIPHDDFVQRYHVLLTEKPSDLDTNTIQICESIMAVAQERFHIEPRLWAVGNTKVFFRNSSTKLLLEQQRSMAVVKYVTKLQAYFRGLKARLQVHQARYAREKKRKEQRRREERERKQMHAEDNLMKTIIAKEKEAERQRRAERERMEKARREAEARERTKRNAAATCVQAVFRAVRGRRRAAERKVVLALENALEWRHESSLVDAITTARQTNAMSTEVMGLLRRAKVVLMEVQEEEQIRTELQEAAMMEDAGMLERAIQMAEDVGYTSIAEFDTALVLLDQVRHKNMVKARIADILTHETVSDFLKNADELKEMLAEASIVAMDSSVVRRAEEKMRRNKELLDIRDNLRRAVEEASRTRMKRLLRLRQQYVLVHGSEFLAEEAKAARDMLRMMVFEQDLRNKRAGLPLTADQLAKHDEEVDRDSDDGGDGASDSRKEEEDIGFIDDVTRMDPRLPGYIRDLFDAVRDAPTPHLAESARARLRQMIPDSSARQAFQRIFKWCVSFCTWRYGQDNLGDEAGAPRGRTGAGLGTTGGTTAGEFAAHPDDAMYDPAGRETMMGRTGGNFGVMEPRVSGLTGRISTSRKSMRRGNSRGNGSGGDEWGAEGMPPPPPGGGQGGQNWDMAGGGTVSATTARRLRRRGDLRMATSTLTASPIQMGGGSIHNDDATSVRASTTAGGKPQRRLSPTYRAPTQSYATGAKYIPSSRSLARHKQRKRTTRTGKHKQTLDSIPAKLEQNLPRADRILADTMAEYDTFWANNRPTQDWRV